MTLSSGRGGGRNRYGSGRRRRGSRLGGAPEGPSGPRRTGEGTAEGAGSASSPPAEPPAPTTAGQAGDGGSPSSAPGNGSGEYEQAKEIVLRQLAASARSRAQLEEKLRRKEVSEAVIARVLDRFEELGLVDDRQYAEMYVRSRASSRKLARPALRRELAQKGVTGELAEEALAQREDEDEREDARELVRKKLAHEGELADRVAREKVVRRLASMLARRGYSPGMAFELIREELEARGAEPPEDDDAGL
ncbi:regulatory protein RecX [Rothia halotolerans]|uniref:regulatory protein RecX n=1 Tax=Rothia halotolerans TaxID=405770 RepID=UPI00101D9AA1|nr:regulatory protein RecX [Rothia halotolerans]